MLFVIVIVIVIVIVCNCDEQRLNTGSAALFAAFAFIAGDFVNLVLVPVVRASEECTGKLEKTKHFGMNLYASRYVCSLVRT